MSELRRGRFGHATPLEGLWTTTDRADSPLLVCLHGGGYDNRYFDVPGHSVLRRASSAGFTAVSLTRPGYPADEDSARTQPSFAEAADIIDEAIADVWHQLGSGRPGVVLLGHSIGGAIALHVAARPRDWPLLGISVSGLGDLNAPLPVENPPHMPNDVAVTLPFEWMRPIVYGADWTLNDTMLPNVADLGVSTPSADLVAITSAWANDLPRVAPAVGVPVQYALAEFDQWWVVSQERVEGFARHFSQAPFVDASLWRSTGHNIEHHRLGEAYVRAVLAFAERCAMERERPATPDSAAERR